VSPWKRLLERPCSRSHFVQLYEADEVALAKNVGHYLWEGLRRGEGALVIAAPQHQELYSRHLDQLGADLPELLGTQQLVFWDAHQTLAQFMVAGQPDWQRFEKVIRAGMRQVHGREEGLRAYGEMVGILWKSRQFAAAIRLEQLWNKLLEQSGFSLYCAYSIDLFGRECEVANLEGALCMHTHLVPAQPDGTLETALSRSMDEILGPKADELRVIIKAHRHPATAVIPTAESIVLWLRTNLPEQADHILRRARHHYQSLQSAASPVAGE